MRPVSISSRNLFISCLIDQLISCLIPVKCLDGVVEYTAVFIIYGIPHFRLFVNYQNLCQGWQVSAKGDLNCG